MSENLHGELEGWALVEARLIVGQSTGAAVKGTLVSETDVLVRVQEPEFRARLMNARYDMISEKCGAVAARTAKASVAAIAALEHIMRHSESERNVIAAASKILDHLGKIQDVMVQLETRTQRREGGHSAVLAPLSPQAIAEATAIAARLQIPAHAFARDDDDEA